MTKMRKHSVKAKQKVKRASVRELPVARTSEHTASQEAQFEDVELTRDFPSHLSTLPLASQNITAIQRKLGNHAVGMLLEEKSKRGQANGSHEAEFSLGSRSTSSSEPIPSGQGELKPKADSGKSLVADKLTHVNPKNLPIQSRRVEITPSPRKIQRLPGFIGRFLNKFARHIPGYTLITVIIGKNPLTGEAVARNAKNLVGGFLGLIPGGTILFDKLNEAGAVDQALTWFLKQIRSLNITWSGIKALISEAWDRVSIWYGLSRNIKIVKEVFGPTVSRIFSFVKSIGGKVMEFIFRGALKLVGAPVKRVMGILNKGKSVLINIIKNPVGFIKNLVKGLGQGVGQFGANILQHLKKGITGWLFGTLAKANIQLPEKFDIKGVFTLATQLLGMSYQAIRTLAIRKLGPQGEAIMARVEQTVGVVKELIAKGPVAMWERVKVFVGDLKETVFGAIMGWVRETIVVKAITKLLSFFNPASALVQAVIAIYDVIKFFIARYNQIADFTRAVFDSIAMIASGGLGKAANAIENALSKSLPIIISFLARLIGLGGIGQKIKGIIQKIREPIDMVIGKIVGFVVKMAKKLFGKRKHMTKPDKRTEAQKKVDLNNAISEVEKIQNMKDTTPAFVKERLPGIRSRFNLTSLILIKETETAYHVKGKINPEKDSKSWSPSSRRPADLPSIRNLIFDWEEIISGHSETGYRAIQSGQKDIFWGLQERQIKRVVRGAYKNVSKKNRTQGDRIRVRGTFENWTVEMWVNKAIKVVETAYPIS